VSGLSEKHASIQAALLCQGCINLRAPDNNRSNVELFSQYLGQNTRSTAGPSTPTLPGFFCIADSQNMYLLLDGILTWEQGFRIAQGYVGGIGDSTFEPQNFVFSDAAVSIQTSIKAAGISWPPQIWVGGYSFGGAVGELLPSITRLDPPGWLTSTVHSFGAPRPGGRTIGHQIDGSTTLFRWMNDNDPVPLVPPRAEDFPGIVVAFGIAGALRAQYFVQPAGGISLARNGSAQVSDLPQAAQASFTMSLAQWLFDIDNNVPADHALSEYLRRLLLLTQSASDRGSASRSHIEQPDRAGAAMVRQHAFAYATAVRGLEERQNAVPQVTPQPALFFATKRAHTWHVQFSDQIVAACGTRRSALRLARLGNDWLRDLQTRAAVDPNAVLQSLSLFLTLAQEPASGFAPLLNTDFPQ
jgi:hypothetical protein